MATFNTNAAIDSYYEGQKAPINAQMENTTASYEAALDKLNQSKAQADADAYRSYRRQQMEMPGLMRSNGNHGGMVDSAVASLLNKYNSKKAARGIQLQGNIADQTLSYNNNMNELRGKLAQYDQMANADKAELAYRNALRRRQADQQNNLYGNRAAGIDGVAGYLNADPYADAMKYYDSSRNGAGAGRNVNRTVADDRYYLGDYADTNRRNFSTGRAIDKKEDYYNTQVNDQNYYRNVGLYNGGNGLT